MKKDYNKKINNTRNFSIIAHVDHGKSTLADRILEYCDAIPKHAMKNQILDSMDIERERGITIKLKTASFDFKAKDGQIYHLNLIDTPGHVDFSYEVSRSLAACEGVLLVVDSIQGIQAQTLANVFLALDNNLEIIPVINKIDLPNARVDEVSEQIEEVLGFPKETHIKASAKSGIKIDEIIDRIITDIPAPKGNSNDPLQALVFDSTFDTYKGVIPLIRVKNGTLKKGDEIKFMATGATYTVIEVGILNPDYKPVDMLTAGDVGYFLASIKDITKVRVGDTLTYKNNPAKEALPGYKNLQPVVFSGLYPIDNDDYLDLKEALDKLKLNDASLVYEQENSMALGFGFRAGFLGLLHMQIVQERISREFGIELITTAPSVIYHVYLNDGSLLKIDNPALWPDPQTINKTEEPFVTTSLMTPDTYIGAVMELCQNKRGIFKTMNYLDKTRVNIVYEMPLNEIMFDFFNSLKSQTKGYASYDYEFLGYRKSNLVKLNILLNGEQVDALSIICHKDFAYHRGRKLVDRMKNLIPRQMFEIAIQAAIGQRVIARNTVKALRKDVLAKCYGGDVSRKKKLIEKQKEGKKKMKAIGKVDVPQEAFLALLSPSDDE